ncbi:DUF551 domain-containing protein, partial [Citrobacter werkmanii]|uniref:DUF551 domain-containing protein n=1 Tax=Citrobacter werkmanii TaxID=67827 RepID=UPI0021BD8EDB
SLDRLHQIREILSKASAQSDGGNLGYAMADAVKVIEGAIAAFGAEPVAYMTYKGYLLHAGDPKVSEYSEPTPLYTAPPAPVAVPDEVLARLEHEANHLTAWHHIDEHSCKVYRRDLLTLVNACRAAMLQAGNSPVTPDCWIPVSDRMPDKLIPVMVMYEDGEMWSAMWNGNSWDDGTEYPDPHEVTHWREMPAPPKQEMKS